MPSPLTDWSTLLDAPTGAQQRAWLTVLRPQLRSLVLVSNTGDLPAELADELAPWLDTVTSGAPAGCGYSNPRPGAVQHRYRYDRRLLAVIDQAGGPMAEPSAASPFSGLGDVDLVLLGDDDQVLGATVAHERMIIAPQ